jgi:serine/threonine protein phosphatase PrpC
MKLYLNNYVGRKDELSFRTYSGEVKRGDMFIYCTDGFYHTLTEENIAYVYKHIKNGNADELSLDMIRRRMDCGETDNISVGFMYCG